TALRKEGRMTQLLADLSHPSEDDLLAAIGYGRVTSHQVLARLLPAEQLQRPQPAEGALRRLMRKIAGQEQAVRVGGIDDVLVRFGKCCEPLPGERIVGFITRGRGVTVHSIDCNRVLESDPQRRVEVSWDDTATAPRAVSIEVMCIDQTGMLAAITKAISSAGVNISRLQARSAPDAKAVNSLDIVVGHIDQLNQVIRALNKVRGVMRVSRVRG
ncbi:MAG TPA: ACT domain-containing protein, partial [Terriglobales bacterium]|nr:ACT domain-containing protein [Terriglobales bacterium]